MYISRGLALIIHPENSPCLHIYVLLVIHFSCYQSIVLNLSKLLLDHECGRRKEEVHHKTTLTLLLAPFWRTQNFNHSSYIDEKNYNLWERVVRTALKAKNKLGCIDGILMQPTRKGDEYFSKANVWDMVNSMLCSWILDILDPKLHMSIGIAYPKNYLWDVEWFKEAILCSKCPQKFTN